MRHVVLPVSRERDLPRLNKFEDHGNRLIFRKRFFHFSPLGVDG